MGYINKKIHFIGISGAGMIAIAQYLRAFGRCKLSGSDISISKAAKSLEQQGVEIFNEHNDKNLKNVDIVVYSSAIPDKNVELKYCKKKKIKTFSRGEFLALIMKKYNRKGSVVGTHGKTTTTGLMIHILDFSGVGPSFMIGGELPPYYSNGRYSESSTFFSELDESDGSFLYAQTDFSIITNIEEEHMNFYKSKDVLIQAFDTFIKNIVTNNGRVIVNKDDQNCNELCQLYTENCVFFSLEDPSAEFYADNIQFFSNYLKFDCVHQGKKLGTFSAKLLGKHNVYNVLSAIALSINMGISVEKIQQGLMRFNGVKRRMQLISEAKNITVYDDYAHHPTEVKTTLDGLRRAQKKKITCVFQPHRHSRVKEHLVDFFDAFNTVDTLLLAPIYSANEDVSDELLLDKMADGIKKKMSGKLLVFSNYNDIIKYLSESVKSGEIVLTMGAGDVFKISHQLAEHYSHKK